MAIKYGSLMYFPSVDKLKWKESISRLVSPKVDIDFNLRPHITVLYGFVNSRIELEFLGGTIQNFLANNQLSLNAEQITTFDNITPVVKIDIIDLNGNLTKLNDIIQKEFNTYSEFPIYKPHITIGKILSPGISIQKANININDFGFENLNVGIFKYFDGVGQTYSI